VSVIPGKDKGKRIRDKGGNDVSVIPGKDKGKRIRDKGETT
jgi:hypothetical protein